MTAQTRNSLVRPETLFASASSGTSGLDFRLPAELEASLPPEARGLARDGVRLMVSWFSDDRLVHTHFREIGGFLRPGDVVVINTSGTLNAALPAARADGAPLELHLSTRLPAGLWVVELRTPNLERKGTRPFYHAAAGERLSLPAGGEVTLLTPYAPEQAARTDGPVRLWVAALNLPDTLLAYLAAYGFPIRYSYVPDEWPSGCYQTVYATEPGSAEMPSAGRAFTPEVITQLAAKGIVLAPLILHTGVASLEDHEPPYEEFYRVPTDTARLVNSARAAGRRVVAVGTTVVRALETVAEADGVVHPGEGWTHLIITPVRGLRAVDGLLTGFHEPRASHLAMLTALAGRPHLEIAYAEALHQRYLWHEFGDLHLILR
jgi:S-adenosylmethionine:tRNA ribosyltransferase-isomerase